MPRPQVSGDPVRLHARPPGLVPTVAVPGPGCPVAGHLPAAGPRNGHEGGPAALGRQESRVGQVERGLCTW